MPVNIHVVGDLRWVLAKQMREYLRLLERVSKQGKVTPSDASQINVYETLFTARLKGLPVAVEHRPEVQS